MGGSFGIVTWMSRLGASYRYSEMRQARSPNVLVGFAATQQKLL
jgi:hypothetical protein